MAKFIKDSSDVSKSKTAKRGALQTIAPGQLSGVRQADGQRFVNKVRSRNLPNATIVYGVGASVLLVVGVYTVFVLANWFTGLLVFILGCALVGYALYFLRYQ